MFLMFLLHTTPPLDLHYCFFYFLTIDLFKYCTKHIFQIIFVPILVNDSSYLISFAYKYFYLLKLML